MLLKRGAHIARARANQESTVPVASANVRAVWAICRTTCSQRRPSTCAASASSREHATALCPPWALRSAARPSKKSDESCYPTRPKDIHLENLERGHRDFLWWAGPPCGGAAGMRDVCGLWARERLLIHNEGALKAASSRPSLTRFFNSHAVGRPSVVVRISHRGHRACPKPSTQQSSG